MAGGARSLSLRIGTAGWAIPRAVADQFPAEGAGLARYAARFDCVEINSTFYRPHRTSTFARWCEITPEDFRFAVKAPRSITHEARLVDGAAATLAFVGALAPLRPKLAVVLLQTPPSLAFDPDVATAFFDGVRQGEPELKLALEPRHASWFTPDAEALLAAARIVRVAADPAKPEGAGEPGGWSGWSYHRLHGSPRMYYSAYGESALATLADKLSRLPRRECWCVFDNTTSGAAAADALALQRLT